MEIDLTDEQAEKVEILKENGIEIGEAIDILFEMKDSLSEQNNFIIDARINEVSREKAELEEKIAKMDDELSLFTKLKDSSMDPAQKQKMVEKEYGKINNTYDESVQKSKHKFKWSKAIFNF